MATVKQILANRRNAQKSTGPKTAEGRAIVSRNAITHGLTAARAVVLPEEQEEFNWFAAALREEWDPQEPSERFYMDRMIEYAWRLKRVTRLETGVLLAARQTETAVAAQDDAALLGRVYLKSHDVLDHLSRYERQLERSLREAQRELELALWTRETLANRFYARNLRKFPADGMVRPPVRDPFKKGQP